LVRSLDLERYEAAFRENEIDDTVLPNLTAEDLKDLGVVIVGHRRKLLDAIAALRPDAEAKALPSDALPTIDSSSAERRQVTVMFSDLVGSTALSTRMLLQHLNMVRRRDSCISHGRDPASAGSGLDQDFLPLAVQLGR
jgi:SAM domain (Sterile alpha motif)